MRYNDEVTKTGQRAWAAAQDAQQRDKRYRDHYTPEQQAHGEELLGQVKQAFFRSKVYLNYRQNFMAIRVQKPTREDLASVQAFELLASLEQDPNTYMIVKSQDTLIIRIK